MAVAVTARRTAAVIAAPLQRPFQLGLEYLLDETSYAAAYRRLQRIEPVLTPEWLWLGRCASLFHGVISWRLAGRLLG